MRIQKFFQQGKRDNNEDCYGICDGLFTVCDGMGGHNYGERASAFVVERMLQSFTKPQPLGKIEIQQQLNKIQSELNLLLDKEPELEDMGTTFTGIFRTPDVWYAAHIGDSRIYLFRSSEKKLWHTWDHSFVGELMRKHVITLEAGRFHPMSNRISKAIIARKKNNPASASIVKIDELKEGDVLMLCSDGVVEAWGDWELVKLFSNKEISFGQKCIELAKQCDESSKDNNTALLIEIEKKDAFSYGDNDDLEWTSFDEIEADYRQYLKDNGDENIEMRTEEVQTSQIGENKTNRKTMQEHKSYGLWFLFIGILAIIVLVYFYNPFNFGKLNINKHRADTIEQFCRKKTKERGSQKENNKKQVSEDKKKIRLDEKTHEKKMTIKNKNLDLKNGEV